MRYSPLAVPSSRREFYAQTEAQYSDYAREALEALEAIRSDETLLHTVEQERAPYLSQGPRKPEALERLEAQAVLDAPDIINGKKPTERVRDAWVTQQVREHPDYPEYLAYRLDAENQIAELKSRMEYNKRGLSVAMALMAHLDAWVSFMSVPKPQANKPT